MAGHPMMKMMIDESGAIWSQPAGLVKRYGIGRTTTYTLLEEMKVIPKYGKSFLDLSHTLKLVKLEDWEAFLQEKSRRRMHAVRK